MRLAVFCVARGYAGQDAGEMPAPRGRFARCLDSGIFARL
jgi:hypothetical protein